MFDELMNGYSMNTATLWHSYYSHHPDTVYSPKDCTVQRDAIGTPTSCPIVMTHAISESTERQNLHRSTHIMSVPGMFAKLTGPNRSTNHAITNNQFSTCLHRSRPYTEHVHKWSVHYIIMPIGAIYIYTMHIICFMHV